MDSCKVVIALNEQRIVGTNERGDTRRQNDFPEQLSYHSGFKNGEQIVGKARVGSDAHPFVVVKNIATVGTTAFSIRKRAIVLDGQVFDHL
jgi:hypothetical protein